MSDFGQLTRQDLHLLACGLVGRYPPQTSHGVAIVGNTLCTTVRKALSQPASLIFRPLTGVIDIPRPLRYFSDCTKIAFKIPIPSGRILKIEGGEEAEAIWRFLESLVPRLGDAVYEFPVVHSGVHPNGAVGPHECSDVGRRRWIEHAHPTNIHFHIGNVRRRPNWPYMLHLTADIRGATWQVGDVLVHDKGHLCVLDDPEVHAIAARYPERPGLSE